MNRADSSAPLASSKSPRRRDPDLTGGFVPTPAHQLLLAAALFAPDAAHAAWIQWRAHYAPPTGMTPNPASGLDYGSVRLLPLVYRNLLQGGMIDPAQPEPLLAHAKAFHRQTLARNQMQLNACAQVLDLFHSAGIDTLVLKGAGLLSAFDADPGVRPMDDFDVLVPHAHGQRALCLLRDQGGWRSGSVPFDRLNAGYMAVRHARNFLHPKLGNFDLHWHALSLSMDERLDAQLWAAAQPVQLHHVTTRALSATDMLLHICVHGAEWAPIPPIRWIADAAIVLRAPNAQIDWERLVELATTYRLSLALHFALDYLQRHILPHLPNIAPMPAFVLEKLKNAPISHTERRLFHAQTQRSVRLGRAPVLWERYQDYRARHTRTTAGQNVPPMSLFRYLAVYHGYGTLGEVGRWALNRSGQRIRRIFFGPPTA